MNEYVKGALIFTSGVVGGAVVGSVYVGAKVISNDGLREALSKEISKKLDKVLFGDRPRPNYNDRASHRVSYSSYFKSTDVWFDTRENAEKVMGDLEELCAERGYCTVSDFLWLAGVKDSHIYQSFGWYSIGGATVICQESHYMIDLPIPTRIYEK